MARLTDVINDSITLQPLIMEQRSAIATLEEMLKVCKQYVRVARPQVHISLPSCSHFPGTFTRSLLFLLAAMLAYLEEEDVEALLETTFFIIRRYWGVLHDATATIGKNMLLSLLEKHSAMVEMYISKLPSLSCCKGLEGVEKTLKAMRPTLTMEEALGVFAQRVSHENAGVVHQALTELAPYLRDNQSALYTSAVSQRPDNAITTILRSLLDCACKYSGSQMDIARLCVQCIGLIGCLDSNQIETVREQRSIVVLNNFVAPEEMTDFGLFMLEEGLSSLIFICD
ncbi:serine/threonine-protein kinase M1 [Metarhizium acridum]|nr:serine/threonine-protein kinase M1 [Metarhizium acridum]